MSDEHGPQAWLTDTMARLDDLRVEAPLPAWEVRLRSTRRRRRRMLAATATVITVTALAATAPWHLIGSDRAEVNQAHLPQPLEMRVTDELRSYYSAIPDALGSRDPGSTLSKLMTVHFTDRALKEEAHKRATALSGGGTHPAATCGPVNADTTFTVSHLSPLDGDSIRARVLSNNTPDPAVVIVDVDVRTMKIAKWSCDDG